MGTLGHNRERQVKDWLTERGDRLRPELTPVDQLRLTPTRLRIYHAQTRRNLATVHQINAQLDMRLADDLKARIRAATARAVACSGGETHADL